MAASCGMNRRRFEGSHILLVMACFTALLTGCVATLRAGVHSSIDTEASVAIEPGMAAGFGVGEEEGGVMAVAAVSAGGLVGGSGQQSGFSGAHLMGFEGIYVPNPLGLRANLLGGYRGHAEYHGGALHLGVGLAHEAWADSALGFELSAERLFAVNGDPDAPWFFGLALMVEMSGGLDPP